MNNKGFAITTILYGIMILFVFLLMSLLGILSVYRNNLDKLIESNHGARELLQKNIINIGTDMSSVYTFSIENDNNYPWTSTSNRFILSDRAIWTSGNYQILDSESTIKIILNVYEPIILSFNYSVSSETYYDLLSIILDDNYIVNNLSGIESGKFNERLDAGEHELIITYTKDEIYHCDNNNTNLCSDNVTISNIAIRKV